MPFANINRHHMFYEDSGGRGPVLLFSHGFLLDHSMWEEQVAEFAPEYRCITWDARGHGMSECLGPFDYYDLANDCVSLLDQLNIPAATMIGMSQGGFVAMRAAWKYPARAKALVLVDTAAALFSDEVLEGYRATADSWLEHGPVGKIASDMAELLFGKKYKAGIWLGKWQSKAPSETAHAWETVLGRDDFMPRLPEIKCPALVIHGSADEAFDLATAKGLRDALPDCKGLVVVKGAAHAPNVTHPKPFNVALREFLGKNR